MGKNNYFEGHGTMVQKFSEIIIKFCHCDIIDRLFFQKLRVI
jgi:hypothetical protein